MGVGGGWLGGVRGVVLKGPRPLDPCLRKGSKEGLVGELVYQRGGIRGRK